MPLSDWLMEDKYYNKVKAAFTSDIAEKFFVTGELMKLLDDHKQARPNNMQKIGLSTPLSCGTTSSL